METWAQKNSLHVKLQHEPHTKHNLEKRRKEIFPCSCVCVCVMVCFSPPLSETKIAQWLKFPQLSFWILNINCGSWEPFSTDKHTPTTPDLCGMHILSSIHSPECGYYGTESKKETGDLWLCTVHYPKLLPSPCKCSHLWGWQRRCHIFFLACGKRNSIWSQSKVDVCDCGRQLMKTTLCMMRFWAQKEGIVWPKNLNKCINIYFFDQLCFILCTHLPLTIKIIN